MTFFAFVLVTTAVIVVLITTTINIVLMTTVIVSVNIIIIAAHIAHQTHVIWVSAGLSCAVIFFELKVLRAGGERWWQKVAAIYSSPASIGN